MNRKVTYRMVDPNQLKRVLKSGKRARFDDLGRFSLVNGTIEFEPDIDLKNIIWDIFYFDSTRKKEDYNQITNHLLDRKIIELKGFGKVQVLFKPGYTKIHDFHGLVEVDPKPYLKFKLDENFKLNELD